MLRKITLLALLCLWQTAFAIELMPYASMKISVEEWSQYYAKVKKELSGTQSSFKYEAGELENYSESESRTNIAFTTPGHDAHPAWVSTRIVVEGSEIVVQVIGYYSGNETAYQEFYRRMSAMVERSLKKHAKN